MAHALRLIALALFLLAGIVPAIAQDYVDQSAIDELFVELRHAQTQAEAESFATEIRSYWMHPDVPALDRRMSLAAARMRQGNLPQALYELSAIVRDFPNYAEGWNQRATLYFMIGQYDKSLADIARVLAIEPRHFGALGGRAMIHLRQGRRQDAMRDLSEALRINPFLAERSMFPELARPITYI